MLTIPVSANPQGLADGGIAALFWSFIWTFLGFSIVMLSLPKCPQCMFHSIISKLKLSSIYLQTSQGAYLWRPIPLGLRICSGQVSEISQLHDRVAIDALLASRHRVRLLPNRDPHPGMDHAQQPRVRIPKLAGDVADDRHGAGAFCGQHLGREVHAHH